MQAIVVATQDEDRELLAYVLRHIGLAVASTAALSPVTATLVERPVDLIVMALDDVSLLVEDVGRLRAVTQVPAIALVEGLPESLHCELLDAGVDLVLARPFSSRLLSRYARMLLRRSGAVPVAVLPSITAEGIVLDPGTRRITISGHAPQHLTQLEFRLCYLLMTNEGQVLPADVIVERVWGYSGGGNRELVRGLIRRLRRKLETPEQRLPLIENIPGVGYRFAPGGSDEADRG
jgi:DNA-binding response OmpR family regulator